MIKVNGSRLRADLTELAEIGRTEDGGISRTAFSAEDAAARQWYQDRCTAAGLRLRHDGLGNTVAGAGEDDATPAVWSGSHIDTVPNGGPLDGALGTVAALECVRRLTELGVPLARPVRAVVFSDEEGNYGHLLGSGGLRRNYRTDQLAVLRGRDGDRLVDALAAWAWSDGPLTGTELAPGTVHAFVELHIEQGPHLEAAGVNIGEVTSIVGLGGSQVTFRGRADHAGTTPMNARRDALSAAAEFLTVLPRIASDAGPAAVVTCGRLRVEPGGSNVIPERVELTLDFRHPELDRLERLGAALERAAASVAAARDVQLHWLADEVVAPVPMSPELRALVRTTAQSLGLSSQEMPSGAGHDAQNLARLAPTAMIFVPSRGGRSHCPAESTDWVDIENGANVLLNALVRLAGS